MKKKLNRRNFLKAAGLTAASLTLQGRAMASQNVTGGGSRPPNFIIIYCDDLGYGDIGCFGSTKHRTPNLDRMAEEGMRFTSFYVTSGVCTPSRSSLMTGCYPRRVNMHQNDTDLCVLFPVNKKGLNPSEITIADLLKKKGYATACIGKWHLGDQPQFLPTRQGFDYYYGIPYSNDMGTEENNNCPPLPLLRNEKVIEAPARQDTITKRYTEEVINFITANKDKSFFIYLPHTMPHDPVHASEEFRGKSTNGTYGDAVEEIDFSTGEILAALKKFGIDSQTLVIFTSDNGASDQFGGGNGPLRGYKGSTWEGGMREPCIVRFPGKISPGKTCDEIATTMDLLPTFAKLAGTKPPTDRIIDGRNIWTLMAGKKGAKSPHEAFYYYQIDQLQAVRSGKWKLHLGLEAKKRNWGKPVLNSPLQLYNLDADIGEKNNLADKNPDVVRRLLVLAEKARNDLGDLNRKGKNQRPAGWVQYPKPLVMTKI
ncbi:MAG: sulfatase-like hydrolase/transferase [Planctomycetota bacterium]|jgi:arylsulfatase A-like enzyme